VGAVKEALQAVDLQVMSPLYPQNWVVMMMNLRTLQA
jgi:hypothetical protein